MVHTLPDYTTKYKIAAIFSMIDVAELAARLGSINTYDRRGNVMFMEDFEGGTLFWNTEGVGTGNSAALSTVWAKSGSQSCALTAGAGALGQSYIYRDLLVKVIGNIGLESSFTVDPDTSYVFMSLRYYNGAGYVEGGIRYDNANNKIQYLNSGNTYTDLITNLKINTQTKQFSTWKMVLDLSNSEYERVMVNDEDVDMDGIDLKSVVAANSKYIMIRIRHDSSHADAKTIYVDDVILTQNEP